MQPDLTIIIPSKDRLWSLPKAIESCRSLTLKIEIIVIDDGSSDGTAEWLSGQSDLTVIQGEGWGKPWGVNRAFAMAKGDYVRFLDSDDWLNPGSNEQQVEIAKLSDADLVVAGLDLYLEETLTESMSWVPTDDFISQQLGETAGSHYSAFIFRRSFIVDIPHRTLFPASDFASRDDRCFMLEVALRFPKIEVLDRSTLCHRHHSKARLQFSPGLRGRGTFIQQLYIYKHIIYLLERKGELTQRRISAAMKILWPLAHWIAYESRHEGNELVAYIKQKDPGFVPPERGLLGFLYRNIGFSYTELALSVRRMFVRARR